MLEGTAAEFDLVLHRLHRKVHKMVEDAKTGPIPRWQIYRALRKWLKYTEDLQQGPWV